LVFWITKAKKTRTALSLLAFFAFLSQQIKQT